jgi:hypothetical protein
MQRESAGEWGHALSSLRELNYQGLLRVRKVLSSGRFLTLCGLLVVPMQRRPAHQQALDLLEGLLAAALCVAVLNIAAFVTSRLLIAAEVALYAAILLVLVGVAVETAALAANDFDASIKLLLALIPSALAAYVLYCIMYPGEFMRALDSERRRSARIVVPLAIGGLAFLAGQAMPTGRGSDFVWLFTGILALSVLLKAFVPLVRDLPSGRSLQLLQAISRNRKARRNRGYISYLFTHTSNRLGAAVYAICCPILAIIAYLYLEGLGPFANIGELDPALGWPFVRGLLFPGSLWLAGLSYRKALETLAEGVTQAQVEQLTAAGGFTLYLRSFQDDESKLDLASDGWRRLLLVSSLSLAYERLFRFMRLEEMIARALWPYRPVVGIASAPNIIAVMPSLVGYTSPGVGTLRFRLTDAAWQAGVLKLAQNAESIVMIMAGTPGLKWEFQQLALRSELRQKMVLLVPTQTPDETAARWPSLLDQSGGVQDDLTARWLGLFGEAGGGLRVTKEALLRTVGIRFDAEGGALLLTAGEHSTAAYQLALHLAQLAPNEVALTATSRVEELVPSKVPLTAQASVAQWAAAPASSLTAITATPSNLTSPRRTITRTSSSLAGSGPIRLPSGTTETKRWSTPAIACGIGLVVLASLNFWPDATTPILAIGAGLVVGGLLNRRH